jgi:hypothetical protein
MRIAPIPSLRPPSDRRRSFWTRVALTGDSDIRVMVLRMIATNSLAAFTPGIGGTPPVNGPERAQPVRGIAPSPGGDAGPQQRTLETVPPPPNRPTPRGSLLDLRV